ncbi:hypothetical protein [Vibrio crassostreae]|uniref:hypothetical protein n=1 Tax=Vibrio crassostreae TaxID=246167 RepID=UPI001B300BB2|nr:hypothetical protein [Vibrio crassostreae]
MKNSYIDTQTLCPEAAELIYQYAGMSNINEPDSGVQTHCVMCKEKGNGKKWRLLGDNEAPYEYPTEKAARAEVTKLNKWKKAVISEGKQ